MARSAADATRFTQTTPHAYTRGSTTATTINIANAVPPPPNETPQQKVARLREAARQAKLGTESASDRWVATGRRIADKAHKVTVTGLVGLSVISIGVAGWSLTSMMMYNRRKRKDWLSEQQKHYELALEKARAAKAAGQLTPDLQLVLNKEAAIVAAEEEKRNRKSMVTSAKEWVFGGLAKEETSSGARGFEPKEIQRIAEGISLEDAAREAKDAIVNAVGKTEDTVKQQGTNLLSASEGPGMLDRLGRDTAHDVEQKTRGWLDWLRGGRSGPSAQA